MIEISFMSANWVARQVGYAMSEGWGQGDRATNAYFEPLETFRERFAAILADVKRLGFRKLDLWTGHLNWKWASDVHLSIAQELLDAQSISISSYAGGFGATAEEFERTCRLARALKIGILGGSSEYLLQDKKGFSALLHRYELKFAYENHPEKNPEEILQLISGTDEESVGVCLDTGWLGTHGYDAAKAIREVRDRLFFVHLKDVKSPGGHVTCRYGDGCVPVRGCVETLKEIKYFGGISIEHEPEDHSPDQEVSESRAMLEQWLA
ncbi:MAG TPA: sugar phosphate isomerase/epimerase family protein [Spirochaetia bacterium]|nr:sugar phosphate isomerase/epimerase family protein [Spirochaetia bacterium]